MFRPKNINFITIIITLEGIEKIKPKKNKLDNKTASVYNLNGSYFPTIKIHHREKLAQITKSSRIVKT